MPTINLSDPVNDTTADAALIANNNALIEALLNGGLDNSNLTALANIVVTKLAAGTEGQVLQVVSGVATWAAPTAAIEPGMVFDWPGAVAPTGYLLCDGTSYLRATYPSLFTNLGGASSPWGLADGTHFNVPNIKGKTTVMLDGAQTEFDALAEAGGAKTVTLAEANLPAHVHTDGSLAVASHTHGPGSLTVASHDHGGGNHNHNSAGSTTGINGADSSVVRGTNTLGDMGFLRTSLETGYTVVQAEAPAVNGGATASTAPDVSGSTGSVGSGTAVTNLQPYVVMNKIIKT